MPTNNMPVAVRIRLNLQMSLSASLPEGPLVHMCVSIYTPEKIRFNVFMPLLMDKINKLIGSK